MADKTVEVTVPGASPSSAHVTTSGSVTAGLLSLVFDDATPMSDVMDALEVIKLDIVAYYGTRR